MIKYITCNQQVIANVLAILRSLWKKPMKTAKQIHFGSTTEQKYDTTIVTSTVRNAFSVLSEIDDEKDIADGEDVEMDLGSDQSFSRSSSLTSSSSSESNSVSKEASTTAPPN